MGPNTCARKSSRSAAGTSRINSFSQANSSAAAPVIPGRHTRLAVSSPTIAGVGPTRLISPRSTLIIRGSPSSLNRRSQRPTTVNLHPPASHAIVRYRYARNGTCPNPDRLSRTNAGPRELNRIAKAIVTSTGSNPNINIDAAATSKTRFRFDCDQKVSPDFPRVIGQSATSASNRALIRSKLTRYAASRFASRLAFIVALSAEAGPRNNLLNESVCPWPKPRLSQSGPCT